MQNDVLNTESVPQTGVEAEVTEENTVKEQGNFLNSLEARIIGCLMEKELTVPDTYPLTLNSLMLACNQKSNREPLMSLSEGEIRFQTNVLANREWVEVDYGGKSYRYQHKVRRVLQLTKAEQAVLCVLLLRDAQTLNDLKVRTKRMCDFSHVDDILQILQQWQEREDCFLQVIPKGAGQREDRYTHTLCGEVMIKKSKESPAVQTFGIEGQLEDLQNQITELAQRIEQLESSIKSTA